MLIRDSIFRFRRSLFILFVGFLSISVNCNAEIYKWVDDTGRVHFSDVKPVQKKAESVTVEVNTYSHVSVEIMPDDLLDNTTATKTKKVVMYSTVWCGVCKKAKRYFKKNSIAYTEYDIEKSSKAHKRFKRLGGKGVPLIIVGKNKMSGFGAANFARMYNAQ